MEIASAIIFIIFGGVQTTNGNIMAVSKSCGINQPNNAMSSLKANFKSLKNSSKKYSLLHEKSYSLKKYHDKVDISLLKGVKSLWFNSNTKIVTPQYNVTEALNYFSEAKKIEDENPRYAIYLLSKGLIAHPENHEMRFYFSRLLQSVGSSFEALEQFRLAKEVKKNNSKKYSKRYSLYNPLFNDYSVKWNFTPTNISGNINNGVIEKLSKHNSWARYVCFFAIIMFSFVFGSSAIGNYEGVETKINLFTAQDGKATIIANVMDENLQTWDNGVVGKIYRNAENPDSLLMQNNVVNGILKLENIPTGIKDMKLMEERFAAYPVPFNKSVVFAYQLEEESNVRTELVNMAGQVIYQNEKQNVFPGRVEEEIVPTQNLPDGSYVQRVIVKERDGDMKIGGRTIIKNSNGKDGAPIGRKLVNENYLKSANMQTEEGKHLLTLDGPFTKKTTETGIELPTGQTIDLGDLIAEIDSTYLEADVKNQYGQTIENATIEVYKDGEQIGQRKTNNGKARIGLALKEATNLEAQIYSENAKDTAKINTSVTQAGVKNLGDATLQQAEETTVKLKAFDPKTRWNKPSETDGSTWSRKTPTGINEALDVTFYIDGQAYNTKINENGIAEVTINQELDNNPDSVKILGGDKYYNWGRNNIVIVKGMNNIKAYNDPDGIPMIKRDSVVGSTNPASDRSEGMDLLDYVNMLASTPRGGGQFRFYVSSLNQPFPIKWDPTKSIIRSGLPGETPNFIEEIDESVRDYYIATARKVAKVFSDAVPLISFEEVAVTDENIKELYLPINFSSQLTGITIIKPDWAQLFIRGPPHGSIPEKDLDEVLAHEMNRGIGIIGGSSPYIEDFAYLDVIKREGAGMPMELSSREKKYYTFVLEDMHPGFRMGDYSK